VSVRVPSRTLEQEARHIANANYEALKEEVLKSVAGKLRSESITTLNRADLEDAYQQGWHGVCRHISRGGPVTSLAGLLYVIVHRRAQDIYRQKHESRRVDLDLDQQAVDADLDEQLDDQALLNALLDRLKVRLNDNERKGITLCVLHGYKRPEAADKLGIDRVVFERIMDGATKKMSGIIASIDARGCGGEEWQRALRDYALGTLAEDEQDYQRVHDHIDGKDACASCRRYVRGLQGLAAILPPLLPGVPHGGHEAGILAHLYRLFGTGHSAAVGTSAAVQGSAAAGSVGAAGGGGALSTMFGSGTVKAVLIVGAALSAAGGTVVVATHNHARPDPPASSVSLPPAAGLLSSQNVALTGPFTGRHASNVKLAKHHARRVAAKPRRDVTRTAQQIEPPEFGFEKPPQPLVGRSPAPARAASPVSSPTETAHGTPGEFGFEKPAP
jgi:RNA polymerase sigma factor (sigma-70 family)